MDGKRLFFVLVVAMAVAVLPGCGRKPAKAGTTDTGGAEPVFDPLAVRDLGKGLNPQRGPAEVEPPQ